MNLDTKRKKKILQLPNNGENYVHMKDCTEECNEKHQNRLRLNECIENKTKR